MKYILAIDQGTTGSRAIVYDKKGAVVASAYEEFPQHFPRPGWVEHDPRQIWRSVNNSIQKVLSVIRGGDIAAIGITNQRETSVLWDRVTKQPACNAIVWQCRRTAARCEAIKKNKNRARRIAQMTGLPVDAYFSATKIEWMLRMYAGLRRKAAQGRLAFGTTDSWVLWNLTGGAVHATDFTNASRTMLFDIAKRQWSPELCRFFSVPQSMLPEVLPSSGRFGVTVKIGKLPAGIPIAGIAGDQQAALFGQACFDPGAIKNTYGTGAFMLLNVGKKRPVSKCGLITTLGCGPKGEPVYVLEGSVFIAGAVIQWLRDKLQIVKDAPSSEGMATAVADTAGVYFVPAFVGLGAPYWNQQARGAISGLTRGTTRQHIVRAALESICYQSKDVMAAMKRDARVAIKNLKVDGGAARNNFLCQFQADMLGLPVVRPKVTESTALGAAYLAGLAIGFWRNAAEIKKYWVLDRVFRPHMKRADAQKLYAGWQQAVGRVVEK